MDPERRKRAEQIFEQVRDLDDSARAREIERLIDADAPLRDEVLALLRCEAEAPAFLELEPLSMGRIGAFEDVLAPRALPERVGSFQVLGLLGAGGMGIVYRARSASPRRLVALKVIRSGLASGPMLRRFKHEAEVLARLTHAGIAQIYETGTADAGSGPQPYFAMELVEGSGLLDFARQRLIGVREKLELVARVCDAVQHAHERGVVHRDLKPMNILVDASGQPKVLDFGVARLLETELGESRDAMMTMNTGAGQILGTLAYMSPEQVCGDAAAVDARADVYSLGVILYQLLSGRLPLDVSRAGLSEAIRLLREGTPVPLSAGDAPMPRDIDLIVSKAMRKEPAERYQSAAQLGDDLRRYLADRPIQARRARPIYVLRKFLSRNWAIVFTAALALSGLALGIAGVAWRAGLAAGALAIASIIAGLGSTLWQADRAKRAATRAMIEAGRAASEADRASRAASDALKEAARASAESDRAAAEQEIAQAVSGYLAQLLESADPDIGKKREVTVREMLDRSTVESLAAEFQGKPRVLAKLHGVIGRAYEQLGVLDKADVHYRAGLGVTSAQPHLDTIEHVSALNDLGHLFKLRDAFEESEPMLREAAERARQVLGPDHVLTIGCTINLTSVLHRRERFAEAEELLIRTTESAERTLGPLHRTTMVSMNNLASAMRERGDLAGAVAIRRRFLERARQAFGQDHSATLMAMNNLASDLIDGGDPAGAESLLRETIEARLRLLGADHRSTLNSRCNLAQCLRRQGRLDEAEAEMREVMHRAAATIEPGNIDRAKFELELGRILKQRGFFEVAEGMLLDAHRAFEHGLGVGGKRTKQAAEELAELYAAAGRGEESLAWKERSRS
ncbi:MAG: tetratricopeptide repeat protein [Phycisphaerales bacterium]